VKKKKMKTGLSSRSTAKEWLIFVIHFVEAPGLWLSVRAGNLALRQRTGAYVWLDRRVHVIVAVAHGFCVTTPAIRLCSARHVELLIADEVASFVSLFAPEARGDARRAALKVRERQFRAAFDRRKTVEIARAIVARKIVEERHSLADRKAFLMMLGRARSTDDIRYAEAQAARIWWRRWDGFEMRFAGTNVPADWGSWPGRYIGRRQGRLGELAAKFTARNAVHPLQAMQNFATAIVTARLTRAIVAWGLDPRSPPADRP
jgi:CRISPR associated protein Cas1